MHTSIRTALYLLVACAACTGAARAQNGPTLVVVIVTDVTLGVPIEEVRAEAEGISILTDEMGRAGWRGLPPGNVRVSIRSAGYAALDTTLIVGEGATVVARLELEPAAFAPVLVEAESLNEVRLRARGFYERREGRSGTFITRAEIENRGAVSLSDVFVTTPGFRVDRTGGPARLVSTRRTGCTPNVFVDGTLANYLAGQIDLFPLNDIAAVEVYRGPAETPVQFQRLGISPCGTVLIWTQIDNRSK